MPSADTSDRPSALPPGASNSRAIDAIVRDSDMELADLRAVLSPHLLRPVPWKSWWTLARVVLSMLVCLGLLSTITLTPDATLLWKLPALTAVWCLYGAVLLGYFLIGHDCGHGSFSRRRWVNQAVGTLCMAPVFNGFRTWTLTHNHHHQFTQVRGEDVDWSSHLVTEEEYAQLTWRDDFAIKLGYAMPFGVFFWILWNSIQRGSRVEPMLSTAVFARNAQALRWSNRFMVAVTVGVYGGWWYATGFWGMLKYHHIPVALASLLGGIMVSVGHANMNTIWFDRERWTPLRGQLVSTYDYRFPRWLEYLVLHINVHIPHHVSVRIPWYHLEEAAQELHAAFPDLYQRLPFRLRDMGWIVWAPLLVKDETLGTYQMRVHRAYDAATDPHGAPLVGT